jgi:hypothetical protein
MQVVVVGPGSNINSSLSANETCLRGGSDSRHQSGTFQIIRAVGGIHAAGGVRRTRREGKVIILRLKQLFRTCSPHFESASRCVEGIEYLS